jgi:outer membrane protein TolC
VSHTKRAGVQKNKFLKERMRTSIWMAALVLVTGSASAQQRAQSVGGDAAADTLRITRRAAIATSLLANPQLEVAREQTLQVRAQRVEGNAIPDPVLSGTLDSLRGLGNIGSAPSRALSFGITVPFPDKFRLRNTIGTENVHVSEAQFRLLQQQIASQTGRTYDSVLVTRMHRRDLTEARQLAADFLQRTQARFNAGTVPRLDVINAQVSLASADNDLIGNARDVTNAEAALNRMLGRPLGLPLVALDTLSAPDPLPDLQAIETAALRSRPEITALEAQLRGAKANTTLTKELAFTPDIAAAANRNFGDDTYYSPLTFLLGLSMPIPVFFWQHTNGDFAETHHRELELTATLRDTRAGVAQDVRVSFATADAARRQVIFIRDQLLPSAREAYRVATTSYALGGLSALDVLSARTALLAAESQFADALAAANSARSDLERAAGVPLSTFAPGAPK